METEFEEVLNRELAESSFEDDKMPPTEIKPHEEVDPEVEEDKWIEENWS